MSARDLLCDAGWTTFHSIWVVDTKERVERELDVAARRSWARNRDDRHVDLWLLIECKSLKDKPVLFAEQPFDAAESLYHSWAGVDDEALRARVRRTIDEAGYDIEHARRLMQRFERIAYPAGKSALRPLLPPLPRTTFFASTMRIAGAERHDPFFDAWRALLDGVAGAIGEELDDTFQELASHLALKNGDEAEPLRSALSSVSMYHPILVVKAPMFGVRTDGELVEIRRCRMQHIRLSGARKWFDVVHADAFGSYVEELTSRYISFFARRHCEPR